MADRLTIGNGSDPVSASLHLHIVDQHLNPHPQYSLGTETTAEIAAAIATHAGLADPHTGYRLESATIGNADLATGYALHARSASAPSSPSRGDTWVDTDTQELWVYYGATTGWQKPWNLPWGYITSDSIGASQTSITTITDITGMSVTWTAVANRYYLLTAESFVFSSVGGDGIQTYITTSGDTIVSLGTYGYSPTNVYAGSIHQETVVTPSAGSVTYKMRCQRVGGTGNVTYYYDANQVPYLRVTDIGPNGSAPAS